MFEGFDTGSPWGDENEEDKEPPVPKYMWVLSLLTLAVIIWAICEGLKNL
jgi:hypothetical protein